MFDIVIPVGPNEIKNIDKQIEYTKKNIIGYRNIYIVTNNNNNIQIDGCKIIDENIFPFKMENIASYFAQHNGKNNRNGWYLQQLLKLYVSFTVEELLDNYLILDADVFFLKPTEFIKDDKFIFTTGNEYYIPYFEHMQLLHPMLKKTHKKSGISHHMLFNRDILKELFSLVENYHKKPFWVVFIESVKEHRKYDKNVSESGCSEYEIYFTYMVINHSDKILIRELNWANKMRNYKITHHEQEDFVSICSWYT
jgi:hypothetical protein